MSKSNIIKLKEQLAKLNQQLSDEGSEFADLDTQVNNANSATTGLPASTARLNTIATNSETLIHNLMNYKIKKEDVKVRQKIFSSIIGKTANSSHKFWVAVVCSIMALVFSVGALWVVFSK